MPVPLSMDHSLRDRPWSYLNKCAKIRAPRINQSYVLQLYYNRTMSCSTSPGFSIFADQICRRRAANTKIAHLALLLCDNIAVLQANCPSPRPISETAQRYLSLVSTYIYPLVLSVKHPRSFDGSFVEPCSITAGDAERGPVNCTLRSL